MPEGHVGAATARVARPSRPTPLRPTNASRRRPLYLLLGSILNDLRQHHGHYCAPFPCLGAPCPHLAYRPELLHSPNSRSSCRAPHLLDCTITNLQHHHDYICALSPGHVARLRRRRRPARGRPLRASHLCPRILRPTRSRSAVALRASSTAPPTTRRGRSWRRRGLRGSLSSHAPAARHHCPDDRYQIDGTTATAKRDYDALHGRLLARAPLPRGRVVLYVSTLTFGCPTCELAHLPGTAPCRRTHARARVAHPQSAASMTAVAREHARALSSCRFPSTVSSSAWERSPRPRAAPLAHRPMPLIHFSQLYCSRLLSSLVAPRRIFLHDLALFSEVTRFSPLTRRSAHSHGDLDICCVADGICCVARSVLPVLAAEVGRESRCYFHDCKLLALVAVRCSLFAAAHFLRVDLPSRASSESLSHDLRLRDRVSLATTARVTVVVLHALATALTLFSIVDSPPVSAVWVPHHHRFLLGRVSFTSPTALTGRLLPSTRAAVSTVLRCSPLSLSLDGYARFIAPCRVHIHDRTLYGYLHSHVALLNFAALSTIAVSFANSAGLLASSPWWPCRFKLPSSIARCVAIFMAADCRSRLVFAARYRAFVFFSWSISFLACPLNISRRGRAILATAAHLQPSSLATLPPQLLHCSPLLPNPSSCLHHARFPSDVILHGFIALSHV
ncbi:hypothetical protein AMAG_19808 [Allomyces macrogynus ATCC 38327]|uniref:Uncharacterized protein n=1 Tax=Allomyces macrogynus (strain ATCC 38327) TaxID=578462 RepID=A0A0L0SZI7_ALLM3|nr:hypothetical protein AMAG_19808 [Allomyces macrogynus ATCC 38327]|eukprot:KNE67922.1 hypothetical protein AMAG_19808 [Allomyces macrogynus ATCC 38327]